MKILVINGPNINMLGIREPEIYGTKSYDELCHMIKKYCMENGADVDFFQSNHEGEIVDRIQQAYNKTDGIIINPAAFTHTSIAIPDAIKAVGIPTIEVHISDVDNREEFRKINYIRSVCIHSISGHSFDGYIEAADFIIKQRGFKL